MNLLHIVGDTDFSLDNLDPLIVSFTGGSSPNATATIDISEDELFELTETFDVNIINTSRDNVNIGSMDTANVNILDNDEVRVYFNDSTYIVLESDGEIEIGLNIELPPEGSSRNISVMATLTDVSTDGECKSPRLCKIGQSWFINICKGVFIHCFRFDGLYAIVFQCSPGHCYK